MTTFAAPVPEQLAKDYEAMFQDEPEGEACPRKQLSSCNGHLQFDSIYYAFMLCVRCLSFGVIV